MRICKQLVSYMVSSIRNSSVAKSVFREKFLLFKLVSGFPSEEIRWKVRPNLSCFLVLFFSNLSKFGLNIPLLTGWFLAKCPSFFIII